MIVPLLATVPVFSKPTLKIAALLIMIMPLFLMDPSLVKAPPSMIASVVPDGIVSKYPEAKVAAPVTVQVDVAESHDPKLALVDEFSMSLIVGVAEALGTKANAVDSISKMVMIETVNLVFIEKLNLQVLV